MRLLLRTIQFLLKSFKTLSESSPRLFVTFRLYNCARPAPRNYCNFLWPRPIFSRKFYRFCINFSDTDFRRVQFSTNVISAVIGMSKYLSCVVEFFIYSSVTILTFEKFIFELFQTAQYLYK